MSDRCDAIVIGSGHNGLVAAILLARAGWNVIVLEQASTPGGAVQSAELTLPGFIHDPYSAFYGLLHASPVFKSLHLDRALEWATFDVPVGAAISPEDTAVIHRDPQATAEAFGTLDASAYRDLLAWWDRLGSRFFQMTLAPVGAIRPALRVASRARMRGGMDLASMLAMPASGLARSRFDTAAVQALIASGITHSDVPADSSFGSSFALILAMLAQTENMPVPVGGAGKIIAALVDMLEEAGGRVICDAAVNRVLIEGGRARGVVLRDGSSLEARRAVLGNTGALALFRDLVGEEYLPSRFLNGLRRIRYGTGMFKVDCALREPLAWRSSILDRAGVVHLCGTLEDMSRASHAANRGALPAQPALIIGQQSIADPTRAPAGAATLWIETHVPSRPIDDSGAAIRAEGDWNSVREPFLERVLDRIEVHAPGLREAILGIAVRTPVDLEAENPNLVGGDVNGGSAAIDQQLIFRPVPGWFRYRTPVRGLYLCSASAHPGGGVHGMVGMNCAQRILRDTRLRFR